jgi:hypothetical protein
MKKSAFAIAAVLFTAFIWPTQAYSHGGGCRKDSPPGQCCHRDTKTGTVHCH